MSTEQPPKETKKIWTPKFEQKKEEKHYEWKIYLPGVSSRSVDITLESEKKALLVTGIKENTYTDEIYRKIYGLDIPEGEFHLELSLPDEELDFDNFRLHFSAGILTVFVPIKGQPEHRRKILLKKGTPLTSDLSESNKRSRRQDYFPPAVYADIFDPYFFF